MPDIPGRKKVKGYISPAPPQGAPEEIKNFMAKTYAGLRSTKYPGEIKENKQRAAQITWYQTKRKYPDFFKAQKVSAKEIRAERKEHPQLTKAQAKQIVIDHHLRGDNTKRIKMPSLSLPNVKPSDTRAGRKRQIRDLKKAAQEQRRWAIEAEREAKAENKRSIGFKRTEPIRASVLKSDAKMAHQFSTKRKKIADQLDVQAARIARAKDV